MTLSLYPSPDPPPRTFRAFVLACFAVTAFLLLVAAAARADSGTWRLPTDKVCVCERNRFYDENGRHVFDQQIFWGWDDYECRYQVIAWRLEKTPHQIPHLDPRGGWTVIWVDGDHLRHIREGSLRETFSQFDPELIERQWMARENRRELFRVMK